MSNHWTEADLARLAMKRARPLHRVHADPVLTAKQTINRVYIGIDTGTNTGVAVYWPDIKDLRTVATMKIHQALFLVKEHYQIYGSGLFVRVEDARKRKWIPKNRGREVLQGAGSVKRDASVWDDFLADLGCRYEMVAPKANKTKMTAPAFKALTGWDKVCSNHARDAAMLVFGL